MFENHSVHTRHRLDLKNSVNKLYKVIFIKKDAASIMISQRNKIRDQGSELEIVGNINKKLEEYLTQREEEFKTKEKKT